MGITLYRASTGPEFHADYYYRYLGIMVYRATLQTGTWTNIPYFLPSLLPSLLPSSRTTLTIHKLSVVRDNEGINFQCSASFLLSVNCRQSPHETLHRIYTNSLDTWELHCIELLLDPNSMPIIIIDTLALWYIEQLY